MAELFISFTKSSELPETDYYLKLVVRRAVRATLDWLGVEFPTEVSVVFCDNAYIHALNLEHRGVDRHTDVLSFPIYEDGDFSEVPDNERVMLGDIVVSLERAREQAQELGHGLLREVAFLAVHSTLHLLGYDHERSPEEDELQCRLQKRIIANVEI